MDDKDKKNFDDLIIHKKESSEKQEAPKTFDAIITRKDENKSQTKTSLVTPNNPKIDIDRPKQKDVKSPNNVKTNLYENPFEKEPVKSKKQMMEDFSFSKPNDVVLPTRSGFSVKNPNKNASKEKPEKVELFKTSETKKEEQKTQNTPPQRKQKEQVKTQIIDIDKDVRLGKVSVKRPNALDKTKPIRQDPTAKDKPTVEPINFVKPNIKDNKQKTQNVEIIKKQPEEEKPELKILGEEPQKVEKKAQPPKSTEPEVHKTTTSTLKRKPGTEIPEDQSLEIGAKAGSKKYKADTRLDRRARSLKKYGKEFEKWKKSQEVPEDDEYIEGDVRVSEGRNSERVITTALVLLVIMILCLFLLFYCNIIVPNDNYDDGRVRISVEIDKDSFYDVDISGNVSEKVVFPGDYIDFDVIATNAYNIKGDNATSFIWDSIFVRFKMYLRIDGEDYENVTVNISNQGEKTVPVIIPTISENTFQTYDKAKEDQFIDQITGKPIVSESDGYYYYNGILDYNQSISLCTGILLNGDAIIPDFANKRCELVVVVEAATADYTSIRERTIWDKAPQTWINFMHDNYFQSYV